MTPQEQDLSAIATLRQAIASTTPGTVDLAKLLRLLDDKLCGHAILLEADPRWQYAKYLEERQSA